MDRSIEPGPGGSRGFRRRRTALRLGLGTVVIAGAVAVVLGLVVFNGGQPKASAAKIKRRALAALTSANDLIMHSNQTSTSHGYSSLGPTTQTLHEELWQDLTAHKTRAVTYNPDGSPRSEIVNTHNGASVTLDQVLYFAHLWITATGTEPFAIPAGGGSAQYALNIEEQIASGDFSLVGSETIDGRDTLHLRRSFPQAHLPPPPNAPAGYKPVFPSQLDMWIDPATYLPVREVLTAASGEVLATTDYDWLPRTPANLAKLELVVPPGFQHETTQMQQGSSCTTTTPSSGGTIRSCSFQIIHP